jgi:hypothetical protein
LYGEWRDRNKSKFRGFESEVEKLGIMFKEIDWGRVWVVLL